MLSPSSSTTLSGAGSFINFLYNDEIRRLMMNTKIYRLLDTIVKIALGAFIAGIFSYITTLENSQSKKELYLLEKKITTFNLVKNEMNKYFENTDLFMTILDQCENSITLECKDDIESHSMDEVNMRLYEQYSRLNDTLINIRLLDSPELKESFDYYYSTLMEMHAKYEASDIKKEYCRLLVNKFGTAAVSPYILAQEGKKFQKKSYVLLTKNELEKYETKLYQLESKIIIQLAKIYREF